MVAGRPGTSAFSLLVALLGMAWQPTVRIGFAPAKALFADAALLSPLNGPTAYMFRIQELTF